MSVASVGSDSDVENTAEQSEVEETTNTVEKKLAFKLDKTVAIALLAVCITLFTAAIAGIVFVARKY